MKTARQIKIPKRFYTIHRPRYLLLGDGDRLQDGDEFLTDDWTWIPVGELAGYTLDETMPQNYRRPLA